MNDVHLILNLDFTALYITLCLVFESFTTSYYGFLMNPSKVLLAVVGYNKYIKY